MLRRLLAAGFALAVALAGLVVVAPAASAASRVQVTKAYYNVPGSDTPATNAKLNQEWIRLTNTSGGPVTMTNWTLRDRSSHVYKFGSFSIAARSNVYIHTGTGSDTSRHRYMDRGWYIWNNAGDTATLRNSVGTYLDSCKWSGGGAYKVCPA